MFALERTLAVLRYCDCSACFAQRSPKLSAATVLRWDGTNTHMLMVTLLLYLPYYDVVLRYERHTLIMTLHALSVLLNLRVTDLSSGRRPDSKSVEFSIFY